LGVFFGWYFLALVGAFYVLPVTAVPLVALTVLLWRLRSIHLLKTLRAYLWPIAVFLFAACLAAWALTTHPIELSAGRDQGSLAEAALRLTQNHRLFFLDAGALSFFQIAGPGTALNFPGFAYDATGFLVSQFPLGYPVWLAGFVMLFGLVGFSIANGILFSVSALALFDILLVLGKRTSLALLGTLLFSSSFLPLWFVSFTLTENLALVFFLFAVLLGLRTQQGELSLLSQNIFSGALLATGLGFAVTRIEGWFFLALTALFLWWFLGTKQVIRTILSPQSLLFFLAGLLVVGVTLFIDLPYFIVIAKALLKILTENIAGGTEQSASTLLWPLLWQYHVLPVLLFGAAAITWLIRKKEWRVLTVLFFMLPALPYLLLPSITPDAPWMLRRFLFILFPAFWIFFWLAVILFVERVLPRKHQRLSIALLFLLVLGITFPSLSLYRHSTYKHTTKAETARLAERFTNKDLLLLDKGVSGDGFMMPTLLLNTVFSRHAVYFFNPSDVAKLDTRRFERVFLITPASNVDFYAAILPTNTHPETTTFTNEDSFKNITSLKDLTQKTLTTDLLIFQLR
jgi:hypothetical protein